MASQDDNAASSGQVALLQFLELLMYEDVELPYPPVNVPLELTPSSSQAPPPDIITPKIQQVPRMLSQLQCYQPSMVSLGPYHFGSTELLPMEKVKRSMLRRFVTGVGGAVDTIHNKCVLVHNKFRDIVLATNVKQCYVARPDYVNFEDEIFFPAVLVDICFIIQFIHSCVDRQERQLVTELKIHEFALIQKDLFLLENQIPFPVIKAMMMLKFSEGQIFKMIDKFIDKVVGAPEAQQDTFQAQGIIRRFFQWKDTREPELTKLMTSSDHCEPIHLLHALQMRLVEPEKLTLAGDESQEGIWYSNHSVMELKAAGVRFKPGRRSSCFTDTSFEANLITGTLTIPPMRIDESTMVMLLNLVAFEMLPDAPDTLGVTSYLCLMASLINSAEDVKELRSSGIIANFLGSDQQVADLFNVTAKNLVRNPHAYVHITSAIDRHYKNTAKIRMSQWLHAHFSAPWTAIAFLFALFTIALIMAQTYFAVFPRNS